MSDTIETSAEQVSEAKRVAVSFFQWWWNQPGTNTEQGFDEWAVGPGRELLSARTSTAPVADTGEFARYWYGEICAIGAMLGMGAPDAGEVPAAVQKLLASPPPPQPGVPRIKPEILLSLREWAAFEQDGGNVEQGAAIDMMLDWYERWLASP